MHYFPHKVLFLLFETGRIHGYSKYCKLVPQHSQLLYDRANIGLRQTNGKPTQT